MTEVASANASNASDELEQLQFAMNKNAIDSVVAEKRNGTSSGNGNASNNSDPGNGHSGNSNGAEKTPSRQELLDYLEQNADALPGGAELVKQFQRTISQQGNANKELEGRLSKLEEVTKGPAKPDPADARRQQLLKRMPKQTQEMFEAFVDELGLVSRDDLDAEERDKRSMEMTMGAITEGVDSWGEDFGHMEDDKFVWNPEIYDGVRDLFKSMRSPEEGITPNQLYILYNFDKLMQAEYDRGSSQAGYGNRTQRVARASNSHNRSSNAPMQEPALRQDDDDLDDIVSKAVLKSWKALNG